VVGRAEGAQLNDALVEEVLASYRSGPPDAINSMNAERLVGRPIKIDAHNAAVVLLGRQNSVLTPVNQMIVAFAQSCLLGPGSKLKLVKFLFA